MNEKEPKIQKIAEETTRDVEQGLTGIAPPDGHHHGHLRRTWGNKIFDLAVWPTIAFGAVYGLSTWAVKKISDKASFVSKEIYTPLAENLTRIIPLKEVEKANPALKISAGGENMAKILISFAVGTVLMAPIKLLEDRRGKVSHWIDKKLETVPSDPDHYAREPKQSWRSVLGGRLVTFLSVLGIGTAVGGERTKKVENAASRFIQGQWKKHINQEVSAEKLAEIDKWTKANAFEMFYTSLCAGMVYVLSRAFARKINKHDEQVAAAHHAVPVSPPTDDPITPKDTSWQEKTQSREPSQKAENFVNAVDNSRLTTEQRPALG